MPEIDFPPGMPEDQQNFLRRQVERQEMAMDEHHLRIKGFFNELSLDHLQTFTRIMARVQQEPNYAPYMEGVADAYIESRFDVCPGCGKKHGVGELDELLAKQAELDEAEAPQPLTSSATYDRTGEQFEGAIIGGDRVDDCSSCHGDRYLKVCNHPAGSHGQFTRGECPDPMKVPCPECRTPEWFVVALQAAESDELQPSPCHGFQEAVLLPLNPENTMICSECGALYPYEAA